MELVKNIFFNTDVLTPNAKIKLYYTGKFFEDDSKTVSLHYCFNDDWENYTNVEMEKTELGYQAELEITGDKSFNISFFNEKNEWDNNDSLNYDFPIEEAEFALISLDKLLFHLKDNRLAHNKRQLLLIMTLGPPNIINIFDVIDQI